MSNVLGILSNVENNIMENKNGAVTTSAHFRSTINSVADKTKDCKLIFATSPGELLDQEFERLVEKENFELEKALDEIKRRRDYLMYRKKNTKQQLPLTENAILTAYERCLKKQRERALKYVATITQYDNNTSLETAIKYLFDLIRPVLINPDHADIVARGMLHWMWQIKRRVHGLSVKNHLAIGFISEGQGEGKTTFVRNICKLFVCEPHEDFLFLDTTLSELTDSRAWQSILNLPVMFLDDVTCENRYDIGAFKSILSTEGKKGARRLGTHIMERIKVLLSVIFTANAENFGEVIKDKTGNRRFLPIMVKNFSGNIPENIDMLPFWRMVNHGWDCFVSQHMFRAIQVEHLTKDNVELLLDLYGIQPCQNENQGHKITLQDFTMALRKQFPEEKRRQPKSVSKVLKRLGYEPKANGGINSNLTACLMKFSDNLYERWAENFRPERFAPLPHFEFNNDIVDVEKAKSENTIYIRRE